MDDEENDARLAAAAAVLEERLARFMVGKSIDGAVLREVRQIIYDHRARAKQSGLNFPALALLPFPRQARMMFFLADIDRAQIPRIVINITRELPDVTAAEIAQAVHFAFPDYAPDLQHMATMQGVH